MRKGLLNWVVALMLSAGLAAEPIERSTAIEIHTIAKRMVNAIMQGNYTVSVDAMHPTLIERGGGRDAVLQTTLNAMDQLATQGYTIKSYTVEQPTQAHAAKSELVVFLKTKLLIDGFDRQIKSDGYLVASKPYSSGRWYLFDGSVIRDLNDLQTIYEGLSDRITLPEVTNQTVSKN